MDCQVTFEELSLYVDGELDGARRREMELHLRTCPACAGNVERLRLVFSGLAGSDRIDMPEGAGDRLSAVIDAHLAARSGAAAAPSAAKAPRVAKNWFMRLGNPVFGAGAAAVAVVALAVVVWASSPPVVNLDLKQSAPALKPSEMQSAPQSAPAAESGEALSGEAESSADDGITHDETGASKKGIGLPSFTAESVRERATETTELRSGADSGVRTYAFEEGAMAAARIVSGGRPVELLSATRGLYENREVWVVAFTPEGESGPVIAAAVTLDGFILYRTD